MSTKDEAARDSESSEVDSEDTDTDDDESQQEESRYIFQNLLIVLRRYVFRKQKYDKDRWNLIAAIISEGVNVPEQEDGVTAETVEGCYGTMVEANGSVVTDFDRHFQELQES